MKTKNPAKIKLLFKSNEILRQAQDDIKYKYMSTDLSNLRKQLDSIDAQIASLLDQRMQVTDQVAAYKNTHNLPLTDSGREKDVIQNVKKQISHNVLRETIEDIYQLVMNTSKTARSFNQYNEIPFKNIAIIGFGLIGGSIAKALKAKDKTIVISTLQKESKNNETAKQQGYLDVEYTSWKELVEKVELIILATTIKSIPELATEISISQPAERAQRSQKLIVIDAASVKQNISKTFAQFTTDQIEFIPTHPMGGSDKTGFDNAKATLFIHRPWIITPHKKNISESIEKVEKLIKSLGSIPLQLNADKHDEYVAIVSHLVFIMATYLCAFPADKYQESLEVAGSGFESTTRLASGSPIMHQQIYEYNKEYIEKAMQEFIQYVENKKLTKENALGFFEKYKKERDAMVKK